MALSYKTRRRLSLLILLVGLPLYIAAAVFVVSQFDEFLVVISRRPDYLTDLM